MDALTKSPPLAAIVVLAALGCAAPTPIGPPTFAATIDGPKAYTVDEEITPLVLPAATGGTGTLTYSLGPEIQTGLAFDPASRTLSGTPTATGTYRMTYRVEDTNGHSAELTFTITIEKARVVGDAPRFGDGTHIVGVDIEPGTYRNAGEGFCYWERLSGFSGELDDILANGILDGVSGVVTIKASDRGFSSQGCGRWQAVQ